MPEKPKLEVLLRMTSAAGQLGLLINGKAYDYVLDAALLPCIVRMLDKQPGKALALLKKVAREAEK